MTVVGRWVDLNADVGELAAGAAADVALLESVSSCSIACGGHAGDAASMRRTAAAALARGVAVGAHPSFRDREGFGRRRLAVSPDAVRSLVVEQIEPLAGIVGGLGGRLSHVKPHGALYGVAAEDPAIAAAIAAAVAGVDPQLVLYGLSGSELLAAGRLAGLVTASEVFADRGYRADGSLVPRGEPGALVADDQAGIDRCIAMVVGGRVTAVAAPQSPAVEVALVAETICIHGDDPAAASRARRLRAALEAAGIRIVAPGAGSRSG